MAVSLALVAGFTDAAIFIALAGLFTAHVTGNFVLLAAELVSTSTGVLAKLLALPVFVFAVAAMRLLADAFERKGRNALPSMLAIEGGLLAAVAVLGLRLPPSAGPDTGLAVLVGMLGVAAMGVQNALGRIFIRHLAATTVMTVNVTQAVIDAVDLMRGKPTDAQAKRTFMRTLLSVVAFAAGALGGAVTVHAFSFGCLLIPVVVLAALSVLRP